MAIPARITRLVTSKRGVLWLFSLFSCKFQQIGAKRLVKQPQMFWPDRQSVPPKMFRRVLAVGVLTVPVALCGKSGTGFQTVTAAMHTTTGATHRMMTIKSKTPTVVFEPKHGKHTATVIFCHGLGDTGERTSRPALMHYLRDAVGLDVQRSAGRQLLRRCWRRHCRG